MDTLLDGLPAEIKSRVHPDWVRNETAYWAARADIAKRYTGLWIAFADGAVIAAGERIVEVAHKAKQLGKHAFVTRVGFEGIPQRIRRMAFGYDTSYHGEALPVISVRFAESQDQAGKQFDRVIPDTGADSCRLRRKRANSRAGCAQPLECVLRRARSSSGDWGRDGRRSGIRLKAREISGGGSCPGRPGRGVGTSGSLPVASGRNPRAA